MYPESVFDCQVRSFYTYLAMLIFTGNFMTIIIIQFNFGSSLGPCGHIFDLKNYLYSFSPSLRSFITSTQFSGDFYGVTLFQETKV